MYNKDKMMLERMGLVPDDQDKMQGHWGDVPFTVQNGDLRLMGTGKLQGRLTDNPDVLASAVHSITITQNVQAPSDSSHLFSGCSALRRVQGAERLDTSRVEDMSYMFYGDTRLSTLNLGDWDTSHVRDMTAMFYKVGLEDIDLRSWDVSQVESMSYMFGYDMHLIALNVSGMHAVRVRDLDHFVYNNPRLMFLQFKDFDTRSAENMQNMFKKNPRIHDIDLRGLDAGHVTNMYGMFQRCYNLKEIQGIQNLSTDHFKYMEDMFECDMELDTLLTTNNAHLYRNSDNSLDDLFG